MRHSPSDNTPAHRSLRIYPFDPMLGRGGEFRLAIDIPYREITRTSRSFRDDRLEVVDYDAAGRRYYLAANLDDPRIAMQRGLEPSETDPQFHQQMVYAVASRVLEDFDRALGRRLRFAGHRLRLFPHAFSGRNAFFDEKLKAVLFGYFTADEEDPGPNLPGQRIFTCLSHDIVAHEVTHAALNRLRPLFQEATNADVPALHEALSDLVPILQRFTFDEVLRTVIRQTRWNLLQPNPLLSIGAQFGAAAGLGAALRSAGGTPDPSLYAKTIRPHARGRLLVCAVFEGFVKVCQRRTADLVRLATGGSGLLPDGELHPDLVNRLAVECARTAQTVLTMCIRGTDYLPPVDPTFTDFLRAMVTADDELNPEDEFGVRAAMIEAFRIWGIRPLDVGSLSVESLLLARENPAAAPDPVLARIVQRLQLAGARELNLHKSLRPAPPAPARPQRFKPMPRVRSYSDWIQQQAVPPAGSEPEADLAESDEVDDDQRGIAMELHRWSKDKLVTFGLDPALTVQVQGFHPVHRVSRDGSMLVEMVGQFVQRRINPNEDLGGLTYLAGVTMIAMIDGRIRYLIRKPFTRERKDRLNQWVASFDADHGPAWPVGPRGANRIPLAFSLRAIDGRRRP